MSKTRQQRRVRRINKRNSKRPVVKIDQNGTVIASYPSARAAARSNFISYQSVLDRCNGKVQRPFALDGSTYCFAPRKES